VTSKTNKFFKSKTFTLVVMFAVIIAVFSVLSKGSYFSLTNLRTVLNTMVLYLLLAIGVGLIILLGEIDLSSGYIGTVCGALLAAMSATFGFPWYVAIFLALLLGVVFGLVNGLLINELKFPSFIATLGVGQFIARGLTLVISSGQTIQIYDETIIYLGNGRILNKTVPVAIFISLFAVVVYGIILAKTKFGRSIYMCGGNKDAARLAGLNPKRISYILFANNGFLGALAGSIFTGRLKAGDLTGTNSYTFTAITAAILGGISFGGGTGGMLGCFIGLLVIQSFTNGLVVLRVGTHWMTAATGALLIFALIFDYVNNRRSTRLKIGKSSRAVQ